MSGRSSGSRPYSVTESNAVDSRVAGAASASRWKRRLVRKGSPSPANMRAGASPSRLNGNTPAVNGKRPGTFSARRNRTSSASSWVRGSATRGTGVPDSVLRVCTRYRATVSGQAAMAASVSASSCVAVSARSRTSGSTSAPGCPARSPRAVPRCWWRRAAAASCAVRAW